MGERMLYKGGSSGGNGGYYSSRGTTPVVVHLSCLATMLCEEPEFQDPEVAKSQFEEYRNLLLEKYKPVVNIVNASPGKRRK